MPTLFLGFDGTLVNTITELSSTSPTTNNGQIAPAAKLTTIIDG
ncbi:hypothetical protein [Mycobacterium sp. JS623]|nr:hypothetical protein [Mycobacterium sp. JS623]